MRYLRWLLFPFSLFYGLVIIARNFCYDAGILKSRKFAKPVICIGNLDVGGAGKSPMTEYLVRLLKNDYKTATLSRGYGRKTSGYLVAGADSALPVTAENFGDEPSQFKHKFPDVTVAVCEKRVVGIKQLLPGHDVILLDDAFQHRAVEPALNILLFDYNRINEPHLLLPAGNMREPFSGRWRAQVLVISKCPMQMSADEQNRVIAKIKPLPYHHLFFTAINYGRLRNLQGHENVPVIDSDTAVFLLTGIANAAPLVQYLKRFTTDIIHHNYPDHHPFTLKNITKLAAGFREHPSQKKIIVTTEKDAQRLEESWFRTALQTDGELPVFVMPIRVEFLNDGGEIFDRLITDYVRKD